MAIDAEALLGGAHRRYVATGHTYPHREGFMDWGWHWDAGRQAWIEDNGSDPDDIAILWAKSQPGVTVTEEPDDD